MIRIPTLIQHQTFVRTLSVLAIGLGLSACQTTALTGPTPSETIMRNEVKMVRLPFIIKAEEDGTATPSPYTVGSINAFLRSINAGHGDVIMLDTPDGMASARVDAIAAHFRTAGLVYGGTSTLGAKPAAGTITMYVERYTVTPPNCGNWTAEQTISQKNNPSAHHGCTSMASLGLMVANPRDLIAGENGGNSTAAAVGAIYSPAPTPTGPTMTLSVQGLPGGTATTNIPAPVRTPPTSNRP